MGSGATGPLGQVVTTVKELKQEPVMTPHLVEMEIVVVIQIFMKAAMIVKVRFWGLIEILSHYSTSTTHLEDFKRIRENSENHLSTL